MVTYRDVINKAVELGGTDQGCGISWCWITDFPTEDKAREFVKYLEENRYEHRGVYPPRKGETGYHVRYR